ncbi:MAG: CRISPR-associated helicase Cas3' [Bacillota bacterium]
MVIPFHECIARPDEGGRPFPLTAHLLNVASALGAPEGDKAERLAFLAGWMHDVGKARWQWQRYIRRQDESKHVPHSVYGGVLFAYCAHHLFQQWKTPVHEQLLLQGQAIQWIRDILDHHGTLKDLDKHHLPWEGNFFPEELDDLDLNGMSGCLKQWFPELSLVRFTSDAIKSWQKTFKPIWFRWVLQQEMRQFKQEDAARYCLRMNTARLIRADRFDAAGIQGQDLDSDMAASALARLHQYIEEMSDKPGSSGIKTLRQRLQDLAVERYLQHGNRSAIFTLQLPTGMGKTLTALKVALTACRNAGKRRIVYVAPYLSILSQAAGELRKATGLEVQQHHSLAWTEDREWDDHSMLILESWHAPLLATTFNQLFRALFPQRAQQTLRLSGLKDAVLIIDEPQVIDEGVWFPFLKMLEAGVELLGWQVILVSATMPPLKCLQLPVVSLSGEKKEDFPQRYRVYVENRPLSEKELSVWVVDASAQHPRQAVIMNTIEDAARLLKEVRNLGKKLNLLQLSGAMTPLHKRLQILRMKQMLQQTFEEPFIVISTQVIEAGVDISFQRIYRALPLFPSLVQAAGRVNRHARGEKRGELIVFPFFREGKTDTRKWVYRNSIFREETDRLLAAKAEWSEEEFYQAVTVFYEHVFAREKTEASLEAMVKAAKGEWSRLAGLGPFDDGQIRVSLFVPWGQDWLDGRDWLDGQSTPVASELRQEEVRLRESINRLMERFQLRTVEEIYERYLDDRWMAALGFGTRKQFMGLMQQFIVPVPIRKAISVMSNPDEKREIKRITVLHEYSDDSGLAHCFQGEEGAMFL